LPLAFIHPLATSIKTAVLEHTTSIPAIKVTVSPACKYMGGVETTEDSSHVQV